MRRPSTSPGALLAVLLLAIATACSSDDRPAGEPTDSAAVATGTNASPATTDGGAQGMSGTHRDTLGPKADALLGRLAGASPDSLRALLPQNREIVTALIAECEQMMRQMKMEPPQKWVTLVRDLRSDLDRMSGMSDAQLQQTVPAHRKRIEEMLSMRRDMMRM